MKMHTELKASKVSLQEEQAISAKKKKKSAAMIQNRGREIGEKQEVRAPRARNKRGRRSRGRRQEHGSGGRRGGGGGLRWGLRVEKHAFEVSEGEGRRKRRWRRRRRPRAAAEAARSVVRWALPHPTSRAPLPPNPLRLYPPVPACPYPVPSPSFHLIHPVLSICPSMFLCCNSVHHIPHAVL